jgi:hypothetical protein
MKYQDLKSQLEKSKHIQKETDKIAYSKESFALTQKFMENMLNHTKNTEEDVKQIEIIENARKQDADNLNVEIKTRKQIKKLYINNKKKIADLKRQLEELEQENNEIYRDNDGYNYWNVYDEDL